jgi:hypothetical protein
MAYYTFFENFEAGTLGGFDSETDTGSLLDFPHYSVVASDPNSLMPYRGAYVMRNLLGDTNDHTLTEGSIDIADAGTAYVKFYMGLSGDFRFTADDVFNVFEFQQAGGTVEGSIGFRVTNSTQLIEIGIGDGTAPSSYVQWPGRKKWVCVEALYTCSTSDAGVFTLYLDGASVISLTSLDNAAAIGQGVLGSQNTLSTTLGAIYYDHFGFNTSRMYPYRQRFPEHGIHVIQSGHLFVGPGHIEGATLVSIANGDETFILYDTDTANINDTTPTVDLSAVAQTSVGGPIYFERGCYAAVAGTDPRGMVYLTRSNEKLGVKGPMFYTDAGVRLYGNMRKARPQNV